MDGSTASLIIIPLVVACSLAAWLTAVYYADSHPRCKARQPARIASAQSPAYQRADGREDHGFWPLSV